MFPSILRILDHPFQFPNFKLTFSHVQGDPHAPPSSLEVFVPHTIASFPSFLFENKIRKRAFADYLHRHFSRIIQQQNQLDTRSSSREGPKSGLWGILKPSPYVLERSAMTVTDEGFIVNFQLSLPGFGRKIDGRLCKFAVIQTLPNLIQSSFMVSSHSLDTMKSFVECIEDQDALRNMLGKQNDFVAFIADGSILPRASGDSSLPLKTGIPWKSPETLACEFDLPNRGKIRGTGLRRGITLILGGGYHGKSTLLQSISLGVYDKTPNDGREFVVSKPSTVDTRSEDGRCLHAVALHPFIHTLPHLNPTCVTTQNASGSTSLAGAIQEALELNSRLILLDEDVCATNFLIRDERIAQLVPHDPITPFVNRIQSLAKFTSFILVVGGCGDYLNVADTVLCMDEYVPKDITFQAKQLVQHTSTSTPMSEFQYTLPASRSMSTPTHLMYRKIRWNVSNAQLAMSPSTNWDLDSINSLVEIGQMRTLVDMFDWIVQCSTASTSTSISNSMPSKSNGLTLLDVYHQLQHTDLKTVLGPRFSSGLHTSPRPIDVIRALNRMRLVNIQGGNPLLNS
ncbi:hypothetical protein HMI55_005797 [Coelomomyces lativittatus]|nr:hypothetical protein HMI55_005797 [Coelomomyces lativittatus]